jgi:hypothetical protein
MMKIQTDGPVQVTGQPDGSIKIVTPGYKTHRDEVSQFVEELKSEIPWSNGTGRRWVRTEMAWYVGPSYINTATRIIKEAFGQEVRITRITGVSELAQSEVRMLRVYYLGLPKEREMDGRKGFFALGHSNKDLDSAYIFPVPVMEKWFGANNTPAQKKKRGLETIVWNPYTELGIPLTRQDTVTDAEVKKAYRVAARVYHPDVSDAPDATEKFQRVSKAYQILGDEASRKRFNVSLKLALASVTKNAASAISSKDLNQYTVKYSDYLPPVRCGQVKAKGRMIVGTFIVDEILEWNDITDNRGQILITYWGGDQVEEDWIQGVF